MLAGGPELRIELFVLFLQNLIFGPDLVLPATLLLLVSEAVLMILLVISKQFRQLVHDFAIAAERAVALTIFS